MKPLVSSQKGNLDFDCPPCLACLAPSPFPAPASVYPYVHVSTASPLFHPLAPRHQRHRRQSHVRQLIVVAGCPRACPPTAVSVYLHTPQPHCRHNYFYHLAPLALLHDTCFIMNNHSPTQVQSPVDVSKRPRGMSYAIHLSACAPMLTISTQASSRTAIRTPGIRLPLRRPPISPPPPPTTPQALTMIPSPSIAALRSVARFLRRS